MKFFHVDELRATADFAPILARVVNRDEACFIRSEGYLTPEAGQPLVAVVPLRLLVRLIEAKGSIPAELSNFMTAS